MNAFEVASKFFEADSHYVYILNVGDDAKVAHTRKVWNAPWVMQELGWM